MSEPALIDGQSITDACLGLDDTERVFDRIVRGSTAALDLFARRKLC